MLRTVVQQHAPWTASVEISGNAARHDVTATGSTKTMLLTSISMTAVT